MHITLTKNHNQLKQSSNWISYETLQIQTNIKIQINSDYINSDYDKDVTHSNHL